ncbi:DUF4365 domain-containing protein [Streptomyces sp. NPDC039022]|uniref:DUF4365 domain-containing protein n=1 Tax=Streptomyces sp. NPDC039022 TaxID=3157091 RepID=UPI0033DD6686
MAALTVIGTSRHNPQALFPTGSCRHILSTTRGGGEPVAAEATSWQKEQVSRAYVHALSTQGGYTLCDWNVDKDGVDVTLRSGPWMVDIQLKCTQSPRIVRGGFSFDLDVETYDKLRNPDRSAPGHLALLIVPPDIGQWVTHQSESIILACHGYWASLHGLGGASGSVTTAIHLPEHQQLTVKAMGTMFDAARRMTNPAGRGVN